MICIVALIIVSLALKMSRSILTVYTNINNNNIIIKIPVKFNYSYLVTVDRSPHGREVTYAAIPAKTRKEDHYFKQLTDI